MVEAVVVAQVQPAFHTGSHVQQDILRPRACKMKAVLAPQQRALRRAGKGEFAVVGASQMQAVFRQGVQPGILPAESTRMI
ncbi:hypothetical protein G6F65_018364 [Rhizopus arrhizus]|nr:hypothetical protein G6F65_018364 [Rhizopus arrhizus]